MYNKLINVSAMLPEKIVELSESIPQDSLVVLVDLNGCTAVLILAIDNKLTYNLETPFRFIRHLSQFLGASGFWQVTSFKCYCLNTYEMPSWFKACSGKFYF